MVNTRLLVHAGAKSSRKDDAQFIIQAEEYAKLGFNDALRRDHEALQEYPDRPNGPTDAREHPNPSIRDSITREPISNGADIQSIDSATYVEDTQLAYTALESQLPTSSRISSTKIPLETVPVEAALGAATHIIDYAIPRAHITTPEVNTRPVPTVTPTRSADPPVGPSTAPRSGRSLSSPVNARLSQSSYLISPALARSSKRRRPNDERSPINQQRSLPVGPTDQDALPFASPVKPRSSTQDAINECSGAISGNESSSELPTSYSVSDEALESLKRRQRLSQRSASDPGPQSLSSRENVIHRSASQRQDISPVKSAGTSKSARAPEQANKIAGIKAVDSSKPATKLKVMTAHSHEDANMQSLSSVIHPPGVAVGQHFRTHVTPALKRLAEGDVAGCFKPAFTSRAINDLERGHWRMVIPSWPFEQLAAFWQILERFIGSGEAGWGIWCSRDQDADLQCELGRTGERIGTSKQSSDPGAAVIKIYCWGEVVKHIYLLLYVASVSKVRRLGLQWLDAQGSVVVQMPASKPLPSV